MKQLWIKLAAKIDALSLRERCILFVILALAIVLGVNNFFIEPQFLKQKMLSLRIKQEEAQIKALQLEIAQKISGRNIDPDEENKRKLAGIQQQTAQLDARLQDVQKGLIRPEKMATLLEQILKRNQKLQLLSLKTLPVASVGDEAESAAKPLTPANLAASLAAKVSGDHAPSVAGGIYKHGVEIVVQGSYPNMLAYMRELEQMPEQIYWNKATLSVEHYPNATLTLTLFTLSLEKKWLNL